MIDAATIMITCIQCALMSQVISLLANIYLLFLDIQERLQATYSKILVKFISIYKETLASFTDSHIFETGRLT